MTKRAAPSRPPRLLVVGFPRLARSIAAMLDSRDFCARFVEGRNPMHVPFFDAVYQVGGGPIVRPRLLLSCRLFGRPVIKHWVGSDVTRLEEPLVRKQLIEGGIHHLTVAPWLAEELAAAGVDAKVVPLGPLGDESLLPLAPPPFTVLAYLPDHKFDFYGGPLVMSIAAQLPHARFIIVGGSGVGRTAPANVEFLGSVSDMEAVYAKTHVLVRQPVHDGLSYMVLESLHFGREVIWNHPIQGSFLSVNEAAVVERLRDIAQRLASGRLGINHSGRRHVLDHFSREIVRRHLVAAIAAAAEFEPKGATQRG